MFTYSFTEASSPLGAALPSTLVHAALVAGAVWASGAAVTRATDDPIDIGITWTTPVTPRHTVTTGVPTLPGLPTIGSPSIPDLSVIDPIPGIPGTTIDPRQFLGDTLSGLPGLPGDVPGSAVGIFNDSEVDDLPGLVSSGRLRYPAVLSEARIEGSVTVSYVIDADGRVEGEGIEVLSATHPGFIPATKEAVTTSRFRPAQKGGHPVRVRVRQTVTFRR